METSSLIAKLKGWVGPAPVDNRRSCTRICQGQPVVQDTFTGRKPRGLANWKFSSFYIMRGLR